MTDYYGPWTQAPDFTAQSAMLLTAADDISIETVTVDGYVTPTPGEARATILASAEAPYDDTFTYLGGTVWYQTNYVGGPFDPTPQTVRSAGRNYAVRGASAWQNGIRNWAPILLAEIPPDATGWQWQSDMSTGTAKPSDVVQVIWTPTVTDTSYDSTRIDHENVDPFMTGAFAVDGTWDSDTSPEAIGSGDDNLLTWGDLAISAAPLLNLLDGPNATPVVSPSDLTPYLDDQGRIAVAISMIFAGERPDISGSGHVPSVPYDLTADEGYITYGFSYGTEADALAWTFKPPVFRWIYDHPVNLPAGVPRRIYPRDDGLTGGARRVYPPSKSQQRGRRTFGDYL